MLPGHDSGMLIAVLMIRAQVAQTAPRAPLPDYAHAETAAEADARAATFHAGMDANGDGYVAPAEMAAYLDKRLHGAAPPGVDAAHPLPPTSAAYFTAADGGHDGRLSLAEVLAAERADFARQDADHDGVVTPAEWMAFLRQTMHDAGMPPRRRDAVPAGSGEARR